VVVGWGNHTSFKLVFWNLGLAIELLPGDTILFLSRILYHNSVDVQGNCFVHQNLLNLKDRKHKELTGYGHAGKPGKKTKKVKHGKEKEKEQQESEKQKKKEVVKIAMWMSRT